MWVISPNFNSGSTVPLFVSSLLSVFSVYTVGKTTGYLFYVLFLCRNTILFVVERSQKITSGLCPSQLCTGKIERISKVSLPDTWH